MDKERIEETCEENGEPFASNEITAITADEAVELYEQEIEKRDKTIKGLRGEIKTLKNKDKGGDK